MFPITILSIDLQPKHEVSAPAQQLRRQRSV